MNNFFKSALSILVLLSFSLFLVTGCSSNNRNEHREVEDTTVEETKKPSPIPTREYYGTWHADSVINIPHGTNPTFNDCEYFHFVFNSTEFNPNDQYYYTITFNDGVEEHTVVSRIEADFEESVDGYVTGASAAFATDDYSSGAYFPSGVYTVYIYLQSELVSENGLVFQDSCTMTRSEDN